MVRRLLLLVLVLAVFMQPALAYDDYNTSGSITYSYAQSNTYGLADLSCYNTPAPQSIYHLFTDAKYLDSMLVSNIYKRSTGVEYTINDYTTFTATVDGVFYGSGTIGLIESTSVDVRIDIEFLSINDSYADTLTGIKTISLTYDNSILSDVTVLVGGTTYTANVAATVLTAANPSGIASSQGAYPVYTHCTYFTGWASVYSNDYDYDYNSTTGLSSIDIEKGTFSSKWNVHNSTGGSYFYESAYNLNDISQSFFRGAQVHANVTFNVDGGTHVTRTIDPYGVDEEDEEEDDYIPCEVSTDNSSYLRGDMVTVYYNTSTAGELRVYVDQTDLKHQRTISGPTEDGVWTFYISDDEPFGLYQVMLTNSLNVMLDTAYYNLSSSGSVLSVVPEYSELYDNIFIWYQTINESVLSIVALSPDPDVEVFNTTVNSSSLTYLEWTPTVYPGGYNFYLYDDETLDDYVYITYTEEPAVPTPTEDANATATEETLAEGETMTDYYNGKFREFAPTAWGLFILSMVLWLLAIVSSFGGGKSGRRR